MAVEQFPDTNSSLAILACAGGDCGELAHRSFPERLCNGRLVRANFILLIQPQKKGLLALTAEDAEEKKKVRKRKLG